jgi:hypothetical protein
MTYCIDITNLVKYLRRSIIPHLVFDNYYFQIFFDGGDNPAWDAYLNTKVAKIGAWPEWQRASGLIHLDVRADHVRDDPPWPRKKKFSLQRDWIEREGLGELCAWPGLRIFIDHTELESPHITQQRYISSSYQYMVAP